MLLKQGKITPILDKKHYILSIAHNEKEGTVAITTTQGLIFFYQNIAERGLYYFRLFKIVCCCPDLTCQIRIWFANEQNLWYTTGSDNLLLSWQVSKVKAHSRRTVTCEKCSKVFVKCGVALFGDHFLESFVRVDKVTDGSRYSYLGQVKIQHPD